MEEDPLIPLVHVWNNAAFDHASSASAWHTHTTAGAGDKENQRPDPGAADVGAEIDRIEAEILRLSSRLHHLRCAPQPEEVGKPAAKAARPRMMRGLGTAAVNPEVVTAAVNPDPLADEKQLQPPRAAWGLKPAKQAAAPRGRGLSLGPLDTAAANPRVPAAAAPQPIKDAAAARPILKPIKEPPVQRRRGVSLGPLEIHRGVSSRPAARVKPFPDRLSSVREQGQHSKQHAVPAKPWPSSNARQALDAKQGTIASRAKARSGSMSPSRFRRQSTSKATETKGGNAKATETRGGNAAVGANKMVGEVKAKDVSDRTGSGGRRPAGSSKVRVVPSRYSLTPCSSLEAGTQERQRKPSRPGSAGGASQRGEIRAKFIEPSNDDLSPETIAKVAELIPSPETIAKVAELLPRIRTIPPLDESPRDSGCAKRVADLVGKRSFFADVADDDNGITPYQDRVLEVESPEAVSEEA